MTMISQLPPLQPGQLETWLVCLFAVLVIIGAAMKVLRKNPSECEFVRQEEFRVFRAAVERDLGGLRDRIDSRHLGIVEALEKLRADLLADSERRAVALHERLNRAEAALARLDERTSGG